MTLAAAAAGIAVLAGWNAGQILVLSQPLPGPDAIVSLGSHEWERLPLAGRLAAEHRDAAVLLTQPPVVTDYNCYACNSRVDRLVRMGVDRKRVYLLPLTAGGTYGEALAVRRFVSGTGLREIVVVTSPYHTRRSLATFQSVFERTGVRVGVVPATASSPARPGQWWARTYDREYVLYEWTASFYYAVRYRVWPWRT